MSKPNESNKADAPKLSRLWQEATVAELKPLLFNNQVFASFELIPGTTQIFSLNPVDDYEVGEYTISGWQLVYDQANALSTEYFSALKKLGSFVIDTKNNSLLLSIPKDADLNKLLEDTPAGKKST